MPFGGSGRSEVSKKKKETAVQACASCRSLFRQSGSARDARLAGAKPPIPRMSRHRPHHGVLPFHDGLTIFSSKSGAELVLEAGLA